LVKTIVVTKESCGGDIIYKAQIEGTDIWRAGKTTEEAIGKLVASKENEFGLEVKLNF